jgi:hypothetical protein
MASTRMLVGRWMLFALGPWLLLVLGVFVWWGSYYFLAPLFVPLSAYSFSGGQWTAFAEQHLGWPINIGYSVFLASVTTWFGRRSTIGRSVGLFLVIALIASLGVHGLMAALGYDYWYDSP